MEKCGVDEITKDITEMPESPRRLIETQCPSLSKQNPDTVHPGKPAPTAALAPPGHQPLPHLPNTPSKAPSSRRSRGRRDAAPGS